MAIILPVLKGLCQDILNHHFATCKITLFFLIFASIKFRDFAILKNSRNLIRANKRLRKI